MYPRALIPIVGVLLLMLCTIVHAEYVMVLKVKNNANIDLYNYTIRLELTSSNFTYWNNVSPTCSDIYFTLSNGTPLFYWVQTCDPVNKKIVAWVRVPYISAGGVVLVYMHFNGTNPYSSYNNASRVFIYYNPGTRLDFDEYPYGTTSLSGYDSSAWTIDTELGAIKHTQTVNNVHMLAIKHMTVSNVCISALINLGELESIEEAGLVLHYRNMSNMYYVRLIYNTAQTPNRIGVEVMKLVDGAESTLATYYFSLAANCWYRLTICDYNGRIRVWVNNTLVADISDTSFTSGYFGLFGAYSSGVTHWYKNIIVRPYVDPEPTVTILGYGIAYLNHTILICSSPSCMFRFYPAPVTITLELLSSTMQETYLTATFLNAYGINVTDPWFSDKYLLLNRTVLWNSGLAQQLNLTIIDLEPRRTMVVSIVFEQTAVSTFKPPVLFVFYRRVGGVGYWGQMLVVSSVSIVAQQFLVQIPSSWYGTYGAVYVKSLASGASQFVAPFQFTDSVSIAVRGSGVTGSITITTPTGEKIRVTPTFITVPHVSNILNIPAGTPQFLILVGLAFAIWIWAVKREVDPWTSLCFAGGFIAALGILLGNLILFGAGMAALLVGLAMRIATRWAMR